MVNETNTNGIEHDLKRFIQPIRSQIGDATTYVLIVLGVASTNLPSGLNKSMLKVSLQVKKNLCVHV